MKKKVILTSLLVASCALALASCNKKAVKTSDVESTDTPVTTENNDNGENQTQQENENANGAFFDNNSFVLPDNFSEKDLVAEKISLKQQILLQNSSYYESVTAAEGEINESISGLVNGSSYDGNVETTLSSKLYSNDVFDVDLKAEYKGDKIPSSSYPYLKVSSSELAVKSLAPVAPKAKFSSSILPPYFILAEMGSYQGKETAAYTNNYVFSSYSYNAGTYGNHSSKNVSSRSSSDSLSGIVTSVIPTPDIGSSTPMSSPKYYKYGSYLVMAYEYTSNNTHEVEVGYDNEAGKTLYENATYQTTMKAYSFYQLKDNSFELVYGCDYAEEKSNYVYDEYTDYFVKQDGLKTTYRYDGKMKFSNAKVAYDKKAELINSFALSEQVQAGYTQIYSFTKDDNENITAVNKNGTNSGRYDILSNTGTTTNCDFAFYLYPGSASKFMVPVTVTTTNEDVLSDKKVDSSLYTTNTSTVELDVTSYLPTDVKTTTFDGEKYLSYTPETYSFYFVFVNADVTVDKDGKVTAKVNSVDFLKQESSSFIKPKELPFA